MMRALFPIALLLLPACFSVVVPTEPLKTKLKTGSTVQVRKIIKGDELEVRTNSANHRVRIMGVQAFATGDHLREAGSYGKAAEDYLKRTVLGKKVTLALGNPAQDIHGRALAYVTWEGQDLGEQMIRQGIAVTYTEFPFAREQTYLTIEELARTEKQGLWADQYATELVGGLRKIWKKARAINTRTN